MLRVEHLRPARPHLQALDDGRRPRPRGYTANANGMVKGFVFINNGIVLRGECKGPDQEAVPIHVTFIDYQLVDILTAS